LVTGNGQEKGQRGSATPSAIEGENLEINQAKDGLPMERRDQRINQTQFPFEKQEVALPQIASPIVVRTLPATATPQRSRPC
jgi:hypothetical protein